MRKAPASYNIFGIFARRKRAAPPPKVTPEDLAEFERSALWCELCRTKFLSRETWDEHMREYHKAVKLTKPNATLPE